MRPRSDSTPVSPCSASGIPADRGGGPGIVGVARPGTPGSVTGDPGSRAARGDRIEDDETAVYTRQRLPAVPPPSEGIRRAGAHGIAARAAKTEHVQNLAGPECRHDRPRRFRPRRYAGCWHTRSGRRTSSGDAAAVTQPGCPMSSERPRRAPRRGVTRREARVAGGGPNTVRPPAAPCRAAPGGPSPARSPTRAAPRCPATSPATPIPRRDRHP